MTNEKFLPEIALESAALGRLEVGDVILEINKQKVGTMTHAASMELVRGSTKLRLKLLRDVMAMAFQLSRRGPAGFGVTLKERSSGDVYVAGIAPGTTSSKNSSPPRESFLGHGRRRGAAERRSREADDPRHHRRGHVSWAPHHALMLPSRTRGRQRALCHRG